jgi:predicted acylesterase/phospholipase RssA
MMSVQSTNPGALRPIPDGSRGLGAPGRPRGRRRAPRTAFVLAAGASLGALQAGMLRALYERGISPDLIGGTSAGALNGAYVASRAQTVQIETDASWAL